MKKSAPTHQKADQGAADSTAILFTPRQQRAVKAMAHGWVMREALDRAVGCSNAPDVVFRLRALLGYDAIAMQRVTAIDRDGHPCKPGRYRLTEIGRERVAALAARSAAQGGAA